MESAWRRLVAERKISAEDKHKDAYELVAQEIVRAGEGEKFLKSVRRGRPTQRQNARYQIMRGVENLMGASVPRRREDNNTPESRRLNLKPELEFKVAEGKLHFFQIGTTDIKGRDWM